MSTSSSSSSSSSAFLQVKVSKTSGKFSAKATPSSTQPPPFVVEHARKQLSKPKPGVKLPPSSSSSVPKTPSAREALYENYPDCKGYNIQLTVESTEKILQLLHNDKRDEFKPLFCWPYEKTKSGLRLTLCQRKRAHECPSFLVQFLVDRYAQEASVLFVGYRYTADILVGLFKLASTDFVIHAPLIRAFTGRSMNSLMEECMSADGNECILSEPLKTVGVVGGFC